MKKFESINNSEKFGKKELIKIRGGLKATNTNHPTNTPRREARGVSLSRSLDEDSDS